MSRRIISHREQAEALLWLKTADVSVRPDVVPPGFPGRGNQPVLPQPHPPAPIRGDDSWVRTDWRKATDYGAFMSSSRPPMVSDVPHPLKLNLSNKARARAEASEDPIYDPFGVLSGSGHSFEDLVQNQLAHFRAATPEQMFMGRVWYPAAHDITKDLADRTIGDHSRVVSVMSAFSPRKDWDENVEHGIHFMLNYAHPDFDMPTLKDQVSKAKEIFDAPEGADVQAILGGPKTRSFHENILDKLRLREPRPDIDDDEGFYDLPANPYTGEPDWRLADPNVTIDTHHSRMQVTPHGSDLRDMRYKPPAYLDYAVTANGKTYHPGYDLLARATAEAARRINAEEPDPRRHITPKQLQAILWLKFKDDLDAAAGRRRPEPGTRPKGKLGPLKDPLPRYQRERDPFWWDDPRRPAPEIRKAPNYLRRRGMVETLSWYDMLDDWVATNFPHRR